MNRAVVTRLGNVEGLIGLDGQRATLGGSDVGVYLPFTALEPGRTVNEATMVELVSTLDRESALLLCGILNCLITGSGQRPMRERQHDAFREVSTRSDAVLIDAWVGARTSEAETVIFFRGQLLELMRWIAKYGPSGDGDPACFAKAEVRQTFLRAALIASELWSKRVFGDRLTGGETPIEAVERALGSFRKSIEEGGIAPHLGVALGRGTLLFREYLPARLPSFMPDFKSATGLTIDDYLSCAAALMMKVADKPTDGFLFQSTFGSQTNANDQFERFLQAETQTAEELSRTLWEGFENDGYRHLRESPILKTVRGDYVVLDPTFFLDHMTVSPLFKVLGGSVSANKVFGGFGEAFEDYALDILRKLYPSPKGLVQRLFTNLPSAQSNPEFVVDALVNEGKDIIVAEIKAAFVQEKATLSDDPAEFLAEIRRKYAIEPGKQNREVGVAQLAKAIRAIAVDGWRGGEIDRDGVRRIFPVLIVHDVRLSFPGLGAFLNERLLECLGDKVTGGIAIRPLTVITVDDLENHESSHGFTLLETLAAYAEHGRQGMVTFHNFLARSPEFSAKIQPSEALIQASFAEAERLRGFFFDKAGGADA